MFDFDFAKTLKMESYKARCVGKYKKGDLFISTARVSDAYNRDYETAIQHPLYHYNLIVVEGYYTKQEARDGHAKWLKAFRKKVWPHKLISIQGMGIFKRKDLP